MLVADLLFDNKLIAGTIIYRAIILSVFLAQFKFNRHRHLHQNRHLPHPLVHLDRHLT